MRDEYVTSTGEAINKEEKNKKILIHYGIIIGVIVFTLIIYFIGRSLVRRNYCQTIINKVTSTSMNYFKKNKELPENGGDFVVLDLSKLIEEKLLTNEDITVNKKIANGTIKITKVEEDYIATVLLTDCDYCDSSNKNWSKETNKKPKSGIIDPIAYYNYYRVEKNYSSWTSWIENKRIKPDVDKKYKLRLPIDGLLPVIPNDAKIDSIEQETKEYYRYRDKKWKFYDIVGDYTNYFSSEKPEGYENFDKSTMRYTDWSNYTLAYPEAKSYRTVNTKVAYKWYYMKDGKKVYYKSGEYAVQNPDKDKYIHDKETGSTKMYSYRDQEWRWYNGKQRRYSSFSVSPVRSYAYRDDGLIEYSSWSNYTDYSRLTADTTSYREEETDTRYRYRIRYYVETFKVLNKDITIKELEGNLNQTIDEIMLRDDIKVNVTYKYRTKKVS